MEDEHALVEPAVEDLGSATLLEEDFVVTITVVLCVWHTINLTTSCINNVLFTATSKLDISESVHIQPEEASF